MHKFLLAAVITGLVSCSTTTEKEKAPAFSTDGKKVKVFITADSSNLRLSAVDSVAFTDMAQPMETQICVFVDPSKTYQTYLGIGGALTDASAETYAKLPADQQQAFLNAYFDKEKGIGYTVARTNINSCDFSSDMYTYVNEGDKELKSFNIDHDKKYKIPFIKAAMKAAGGQLTLFASPWSPPGWMKDNKEMLHGGKLLPAYYDSWAMYFTKFVKAYEADGIPVWGISVQNEPMAKQTWESCNFTAEEERDFLKKSLGPTMEKEGLKDKKIIVWDHNRDLMYQRAQTYFDDPEAAKYIWGVGFHWYENWSGGTHMFENVKRVHEAYPNTNLFFTEGCAERFDSTRYANWALGEKYGLNMMNDFNNGMVGFTDWNVLLDQTGGPNHVGNFCYAPIHADTRTGKLIFTNSYYYIGHFSKFITPGASRVSSAASRSQLLTTAFRNPDGKLVVVVMNTGKDKFPYYLWINGKAAEITALPHSISTLVL